MSGRNFDYPMPMHGRMAKQALTQIAHNANELSTQLQDNDTMPQWVQYFIAVADDRINTITNYMLYNIQHSAQRNPQYGARSNSGASSGRPFAQVALFALGKRGLTNKSIGTVYFVESKGQVYYVAHLKMPKYVELQEHHGFHIHNVPGNLADFGTGAGPHFDPHQTHAHRGPVGKGHLGDLPPVAFDLTSRKSIDRPVQVPRLSVTQLKQLSGYPVVLHERGDNFSDMPKPDGGGMARLFGGLIKYTGG